MRHKGTTIFVSSLVFALAFAAAPPLAGLIWMAPMASAADPPPSAADFAKLQGELARMQQEQREQRQLILQLMQMHDTLLKYVQMTGGSGGPPPGPGFQAPASPLGLSPGSAGTPQEKTAAAGSGPASTKGSVSGKVRGGKGAALGDAYVYIDGPKAKGAPSRATAEIKQQGRQFVPAVSVIQVGTKVFFPNEDKIFHNVFSRTPGDAFDLGTLKSGDRPNPVVLLKPGHVEVFCNIHARMRADILVVPNSYWARVRPDGSFQITGVPVGTHQIVLWGPALKPVSQRVDVTAGGATATFSADVVARPAHMNKQGGAYESYEN